MKDKVQKKWYASVMCYPTDFNGQSSIPVDVLRFEDDRRDDLRRSLDAVFMEHLNNYFPKDGGPVCVNGVLIDHVNFTIQIGRR